MAKKIRKTIPWFLILAIIGLMAGLNLEVPKVEAEDTTPSVTVGNTIPVASSVNLSAITLNEGITKDVVVDGDVTDNNGVDDLKTFEIALYKSGTTCATTGDADDNDCYFYATSSTSTFSCSGITCSNVNYTFALKWYAEPGNWVATIKPYDESAGTSNDSSAQAIATTTYLDVSADITYPSTLAGATSSDTGTVAEISNTGNSDIGAKVSSAASMICDTRGTIPVANQRYATTTFAYEDGTALSGTSTDLGITINKQTSGDTVTAIANSYWHVSVPTATEGTCTGTDTFTVVSK